MKKYIYLLILILLLQSCKDTVAIQNKIQMENKKYFNSALAANILFDISSKYFQYGTLLYPRPKSKILRYVLVGGEPQYKMKIVKTKNPRYRKNKNGEDIFYSQAYFHKNIIDSIYNSNGELMQFFNAKNQKSHFKITDKGLDINATRSYYTGCSFYEYKGTKSCLTREFDEENMVNENSPQSSEPKIVNKIFKDYAKYYKDKETIYDSQHRMVKKIEYVDKKVKYYFYRQSKRYEIVCDYRGKRCKITL